MEGYHPFTGVERTQATVSGQTVFERNIGQGNFPYVTGGSYLPPPFAPDFKTLPKNIQRLFYRCFLNGHKTPTKRPTAWAWYLGLNKAEKQLVNCKKNPRHWYADHLLDCPWCAREKMMTAEQAPAKPAGKPPSKSPKQTPIQTTVIQSPTAGPNKKRKQRPRVAKVIRENYVFLLFMSLLVGVSVWAVWITKPIVVSAPVASFDQGWSIEQPQAADTPETLAEHSTGVQGDEATGLMLVDNSAGPTPTITIPPTRAATPTATATSRPSPTLTPPPTPTIKRAIALPRDYTGIYDDATAVFVEVPVEWDYVDGSNWINQDGRVVGSQLTAATSVSGFMNNYTASGVQIFASNSLGQREMGELVEAFDFHTDCEYVGRFSYQDPIYEGVYESYTHCGSADSNIIVLASAPADRAYGVVVLIQTAATEKEIVEHILNTFYVVGSLPGS